MDIKANQFILINGTYQINDFNMCEFLKWDPEEEEYCPFTGGYTGRVRQRQGESTVCIRVKAILTCPFLSIVASPRTYSAWQSLAR
jgi:hypothetical protein